MKTRRLSRRIIVGLCVLFALAVGGAVAPAAQAQQGTYTVAGRIYRGDTPESSWEEEFIGHLAHLPWYGYVQGDFVALLGTANGQTVKTFNFTDTGSPDDYYEEGYINVPTEDYAAVAQDIGSVFTEGNIQITYGPVFTPDPVRPPAAIVVQDLNTGGTVADTAWITGEAPPRMPNLVARVVNLPTYAAKAHWSFSVSYARPDSPNSPEVVQVPVDGTTVTLPATADWNIYALYRDLDFFGGTATLTCQVDNLLPNVAQPFVKTFNLLGRNPTRKALAKALLDPALAANTQVSAPPFYFLALAKVQSGLRQFVGGGKQAGYPLAWANETNSDGGYFANPPDQDFRPQGGFQGPVLYGLFGVTSTESLTGLFGLPRKAIWNWQENAKAALVNLDDKRALANYFLARQRALAPQRPVPAISFPRDDFDPASGTVVPASNLILNGGDARHGGVPAAATVTFSDVAVAAADAGSQPTILEAETIKLYDSTPNHGGELCTFVRGRFVGWRFNRQRSTDNVSFVDQVAAALP